MPRNPNWTRDELILALDLYFRMGRKWLDADHREVVELSQLLNRLPIHDSGIRDTNFRNTQGVSMKLANFLSIDPYYTGKGLDRVGRSDQEVWDYFGNEPRYLSEVAQAIRNGIAQPVDNSEYREGDDEEEEFAEGRVLSRLHRQKERNRAAIQKKKDKVLRETGRLACEVCGFDFAKVYGELGYGFAECHHLVPLSQLQANHQTNLSDLAILCANCHRMIHRSREQLTVQGLRTVMEHLHGE